MRACTSSPTPLLSTDERHQLARTVAAMGAQRLYLLPFGSEWPGFPMRPSPPRCWPPAWACATWRSAFDVTFGKGRTGNPASMRAYGDELGFTVSVAPALEEGGEKISSSAIREALHAGRPERAAELLGRPFAIEGVCPKRSAARAQARVSHANVMLGDYVAPALASTPRARA